IEWELCWFLLATPSPPECWHPRSRRVSGSPTQPPVCACGRYLPLPNDSRSARYDCPPNQAPAVAVEMWTVADAHLGRWRRGPEACRYASAPPAAHVLRTPTTPLSPRASR